MGAKKHLVVLTGAGISAESGIQTFRGSGGLWEGHDIMEVASPEGWAANQELVLDFYNKRRRQMHTVQPNPGHETLVALEEHFEVTVITQNVDDLHERAGSSNVLHLHGELDKARSTNDASLVYQLNGKDINQGDLCDKGAQLRPHIVWFGEAVPMIQKAMAITETADIFLVVGTSLEVYPAAALIYYVPAHAGMYIVDPNIPDVAAAERFHIIEEKASVGMKQLYAQLVG